MTARVILIADDYALTSGVSRAICELAGAGRLSGTSALVTRPGWQGDADLLRPLREQLAIGLHFNLTLGEPLGAMPSFAPNGRFPTLGAVTRGAILQMLPEPDIDAEFARQLDAFEDAIGAPPDFIDGHQHVHALPGIRGCLFRVLQAYATPPGLLLRDPSDRALAISRRGVAPAKALLISNLARGFGAAARRQGYIINDSFAGVSAFDANSVADEFASAATYAGERHLIMCHPGFMDAELEALDSVTTRREAEFDFLLEANDFTRLVWRPKRASNGRIDWPGMGSGAIHA